MDLGFAFVFCHSFQAPEITLQIASHLPAMEASGNAFHGSFFYEVLHIYSHIYFIEFWNKQK
jgi:hypothetical protein